MRILLGLLVLSLGASPAAFEALRKGDAGALESVLNVNVKDEQGQTLLMHALLYMPVETAKRLLDRGADVNLTGKGGATALMVAAGDTEKVRLLVERARM